MTAPKINMRRKMTGILIVTLLCFVAVIVKLFILQFVQGSDLQAKAEDSRTRMVTVSAARGTIYDANGNKLAISITADSIGAYTAEVNASGELQSTAGTLSELLEKDKDSIVSLLSSNQSFVWIKRKVDFGISELVEAENMAGVTIVEETERYYPRVTLAAHVLGFAGIDNQGLEGVELTMDDLLSGMDGSIVGKYDAQERAIPQADYEYVEPTDGYDVYLTIDENIQYFCERELAALMSSETPPQRAGIIIMDPNTGDVLAMACSEPYDPNNYGDYEESSWRNFLVSDSYEPGSTFKIVTAATALEEGTVDMNSSFYCSGSINVAGTTIHCWSSTPHGSQTLAEAVKNSCNPAFVSIGQSIEKKQSGLFYKYIKAFGFGSATGIDLPGEATGILQAEENVNAVEVATISIGQGIAVTPIQMITAACAVANDGVLLKPQIISKVMSGDTLIYEQEPEEVRQVVSAETAQTLRQLLVGVVTDGSGVNAAIDGYTVAGKTGTAQKASGGAYLAGAYVASFLGMVPAEDPEVVCLVIVDEPSGVFYGSQVAAPIFRNVISDTLRYLDIPPSADAVDGIEEGEEEATFEVQVPNVVNLDLDSAKKEMSAAGLSVYVEGVGPLVTAQVPSSLTFTESGSTVILYTGGISANSEGVTYVTVPNLNGKRFSEVANLLSSLGLTLSAEGSGVAYSQSVSAGKVVEAGTTIKVSFREEEDVIDTLRP